MNSDFPGPSQQRRWWAILPLSCGSLQILLEGVRTTLHYLVNRFLSGCSKTTIGESPEPFELNGKALKHCGFHSQGREVLDLTDVHGGGQIQIVYRLLESFSLKCWTDSLVA